MISNDKISTTKPEYYSLDEVALLLKVTYLTVYRWVRSNKLIAYKAGKQYRVTKVDIDIFLKKTNRI